MAHYLNWQIAQCAPIGLDKIIFRQWLQGRESSRKRIDQPSKLRCVGSCIGILRFWLEIIWPRHPSPHRIRWSVSVSGIRGFLGSAHPGSPSGFPIRPSSFELPVPELFEFPLKVHVWSLQERPSPERIRDLELIRASFPWRRLSVANCVSPLSLSLDPFPSIPFPSEGEDSRVLDSPSEDIQGIAGLFPRDRLQDLHESIRFSAFVSPPSRSGSR